MICNHLIRHVLRGHFYYFFLQLLASHHGQASMTAMNTVADVLNKLLIVGITDTGKQLKSKSLICLVKNYSNSKHRFKL